MESAAAAKLTALRPSAPRVVALLSAVAACGGETRFGTLGEPDAAVDVHDAATDASEPQDAGPGACGGRDVLEVHVTLPDGRPASSAHAIVFCGDTSIQQFCDPEGLATFSGLDLGHQAVDVTVGDYTSVVPDETFLDVDGSTGGRLEVPLQGTSGPMAVFRGRIEFSEPGTIAALWMPFFYSVVDTSPYYLSPDLRDEYRLTATEYRVEGAALVPIAFVDLRFPPPPFEEGPDVSFEPGATFASATVDLFTDDPRLGRRWVPGALTPLEIRGPVFVIDRAPATPSRQGNLVGMTTLLESTETHDRAEVAWWAGDFDAPVTQLQMVDETFRVWSVVRLPTTPDAIESFDMPDPPTLEGLEPDVETPMSELSISLVPPEGLGAEAARRIEVRGDFGFGAELLWRIHPSPSRHEIRFPLAPDSTYEGQLRFAFYGAPVRLWLDAVVIDDRDPSEGVNLFASDGRYSVRAQ